LPLAIDRPLDFIVPLDHRFPSTKFGDFYALGLQGFVSILTSVTHPDFPRYRHCGEAIGLIRSNPHSAQ